MSGVRETFSCWLGAAATCLCLHSSPLLAQVGEQPQSRVAAARQLVQAYVDEYAVPGLTVAVGAGEQIVWSEAFGYANLGDSVPATRWTKFRIGSISMSLTSAGLGLLIERNQLNLEAGIRCYVPSFPEKRYQVTLEHLAGHLGGVRHYRGDEFYSEKHYATVLDGLTIFAGDTLGFEPGTRFSFSTYGWSLLSAAIEAVAGEDFVSFMTLSVLEPLGLTHTVPDDVTEQIEHRAIFYELDDRGRPVEAPFVDNSYKWAGGGFLSTAEDLARYGLALVQPGFLESSTVERLWTSLRTNDGLETGYGLGWAVGTDGSGRRVVSHTGSAVGGRAILLVYPDDGVVVALAANVSGLAFRGLPQGVALLFIP